MAGASRLEDFVAEEVRRYRGVYVPVWAGFLRRALIRHTRIDRLHPNPDDAFCDPKIGPSYETIAEYGRAFRQALRTSRDFCEEPLTVQMLRSDGYMILNGHHRWAAAWRAGLRHMPIHIVDLPQETDIRRMLAASRHTRRVALDLDEMVFCRPDDPLSEPPLRFPLDRIYQERLRLGIPALFQFLTRHDYDVWVYSAGYFSYEYIRRLLSWHRAPVCGIVTGTARRARADKKAIAGVEQLMARRYTSTIHIDSETLLYTSGRGGHSVVYSLDGTQAGWSGAVMDIIERLERDGT